MKLIHISKRYLVLGVSFFLLISLFQNCGQPGTIAVSESQKITDLDDGAISTPPPEPNPNPGSFSDHEKIVTVNQSSNKVDVLVVIDNSISMSLEQQSMATRFSSFLARLQGLDWQVGIVTTDVRDSGISNTALQKTDGRLLPFSSLQRNVIKSTDNEIDAQSAFASVIQRPLNEGSGNEQGVKATYRALERALEATGPNVGLIRPGAALSVVLVSDSDETVNGNELTGVEATFGEKNKAANLLSYVNTTFPGKPFKFNSIIVRDQDLNCLNLARSGNEAYGKNYQKLTNLTSGVLGSVCESDYGNQLSVIGDSTTELVRNVTLDCAPADSDKNGVVDLVVKDANNVVLNNYTLSGRIVTFVAALPIGSYKFNYRCLVQ